MTQPIKSTDKRICKLGTRMFVAIVDVSRLILSYPDLASLSSWLREASLALRKCEVQMAISKTFTSAWVLMKSGRCVNGEPSVYRLTDRKFSPMANPSWGNSWLNSKYAKALRTEQVRRNITQSWPHLSLDGMVRFGTWFWRRNWCVGISLSPWQVLSPGYTDRSLYPC